LSKKFFSALKGEARKGGGGKASGGARPTAGGGGNLHGAPLAEKSAALGRKGRGFSPKHKRGRRDLKSLKGGRISCGTHAKRGTPRGGFPPRKKSGRVMTFDERVRTRKGGGGEGFRNLIKKRKKKAPAHSPYRNHQKGGRKEKKGEAKAVLSNRGKRKRKFRLPLPC